MRRLGLFSALFSLAVGLGCTPTSTIATGGGGQTSNGGGGSGAGGSGGSGATGTTSTTTSTSSVGGGGSGGTGGMSICPPDEDGDSLSDGVENAAQSVDTDGDGTPDFKDDDSDGDTIPDAVEAQTASNGCSAPQNSDNDVDPDFRDKDSDNNGLTDRNEIYPSGAAYTDNAPAPNPADTDGDGIPDYADPDNDGDALPDTVELFGPVAVDADNDGVPDLDDTDSDNDTIADAFEGTLDPENDGISAFRDDDSDGDGIFDACEAGPNHQLDEAPADTDLDGKYDSVDLDSDGDGLLDAAEDVNQNCVVDPGETDARAADSAGDGTNDFIETVLGSDPNNVLETPDTLGSVYFVMPYLGPPVPTEKVVPLGTKLNQGDVAFFVDTTATMGGEIQKLKTDMVNLVNALYAEIPDLAVGVAGFDDFPTGNYGASGVDQPFYVSGPKGYVSKSLTDNLAAVQALNVHDGGDFPESQVAAMHRGLTDTFLIWDTGNIPPSGAPAGTFGSLRFRATALPILVGITDASFHNGRRSNAPATLHDPYSFNDTPPFPTPKIDDLVTAIKARGGRFIGVSAAGGSRNGADPYEDLAYLSDQTESYVPTSAFGGVKCATGLFGSFLQNPDGPIVPGSPGGTCRLVFDITTDGDGLSQSVVAGVKALLKSIRFDMRVIAVPDGGAVDAVDTFIEKIQVNASGGDDPAEPGMPCLQLDAVMQLADIWEGPKGLNKVQDAVNETALGITPGQKICFKVVPKPNTNFPQTAGAQVFHASLTIRAKNGISPSELVLGAPREIAFIVPPAPQ
ncbi:MAG: hypothetical protein IPK82_39425 [Polyangiaceae bacterium]|nr:hypothetical protein [Polyangiaceae bacterium]